MSDFEPYPGASAKTPSAKRGSDEGTLKPTAAKAGRQKSWKVVGRDALEQAVSEAFVAVAEREVGQMDGDLLARLQTGFLVEFRKRIQGGGRSLRAVSKKDFLEQLKRSNSELVAKRDGALKELRDLESKVTAIESGNPSEQAAPAGLRPAEVRSHVLAFLEKRLRPARNRDELGRGLMEFASELVREDRERRGAVTQEAPSDEALDRYRRRVEKLRVALRETEGQLEDLAQRAEEGDDMTLHDQLSPLLQGRESSEDRRAVMQRLFEQNLALRKSFRPASSLRQA